MRIFFVCQRVPFPPDRGDKITTFNEIRHLSTAHEVHVFCLGDGAGDLDNIPGLRTYVKSVTAVPVTRPSSRLRALAAPRRRQAAVGGRFQRGRAAHGDRRKYESSCRPI